ncbi:CHASE2 domain-containing protein [Erythrobacter sp. SCSIO 43205]|uniref:ATP-binding protein n=1 Tax=Erythrobacter sp. SCSIO 43205 TaxID=2779361 RepID=UPI001CA95888|nr:ATP-binding protein [Erythrobacter sp. SCSIO 43205]UAB79363.1 CHASE2 domain-containing protein [Erythrobacter sp. SCSIO 43205]
MSRLWDLKRYFRRPSRREGILLGVLIVFISLAVPFEPYDWLQRSVTAQLNLKPYKGDAVIIAIDAKTERELPDRAWSKSDLADLLTRLSEHDPKQIVIAQQYFEAGADDDDQRLIDALKQLDFKPSWQVEIAPEEIRFSGKESRSSGRSDEPSFAQLLEPGIADLVQPNIAAFRRTNNYAPISAQYVVETSEGVVPSSASVLAQGASPPSQNLFTVDLSYNTRTIPEFSAIDVMRDDRIAAKLSDKSVIIAFTDQLGRDTVVTPFDPYTSRAALSVVAAQTLIDGPPVSLGWGAMFLLAIMVTILWIALVRPYGLYIAGTALVLIIVSPFFLERLLIFQETSQAIVLIALVGIVRVWQQGREAIHVYRSAAETKSQFLAQASHDLRQPIHAIGLLADRLSQSNLTIEQQEIVSKISWSVDNARRMFRALLDIAAIESGTLKKDLSAVSVNELLAEVDSQNALAAEQAGVDLRLIPSDLVVRTDRALLGTMLQNLVSNSIRYTSGGKIVVGCRRKENTLSFYVADNGRGIAPDELEKVQKEFYRSATGSSLGSDNKGLGLAIVNRLARLLDLRFRLRSELGKGTIASIEGLRIISSAEAPQTSENERKLPLSGLRVVVADDEEDTLHSTAALLEKWGCDVTPLSRPPEGIAPCDIVLSDFDFGEGVTLGEQPNIVSNIDKLGIDMIIISGHHPDQIRENLPDFSGLILTKPLRAAQLRSAMMSLRRVKKAN